MEEQAKVERRRQYEIRAKVKDVARYSEALSPEGAACAAIVLEGMRRIQRETGPGYGALDIVASALTAEHRRNWAKRQLGKAA